MSMTARPARLVWLGLGLLIWVACSTLVPRQGWDRASGPVVPHDTFPEDCKLCHTGGDWHTLRTDFQFDHAQRTGVPLRGAHAQAPCLMCHNDRGPTGQFAAKGCRGCHIDPHQGRLGVDCATCHEETDWRPNAVIEKHDRTRFPLIGAHAAAACFRCHPGAQVGNFSGASTECATCHQADLARAVSPNHQANGWTSDCQRCHRPVGFVPAQFAHPSSFPLTLGHANLACNRCHTTPGTFTGQSTLCFSCHQQNYNATANPRHSQPAFPTTCEQCHTTAAWRPASFSHPATFPLTNSHNQTCNRCHTTPGVYTGLNVACVSCHLANYQGATNPNHVAGNFPQTCQTCHNTVIWSTGVFAHPASFPLSNGHNIACNRCHTTPGTYTGLSPTCANCHLARWTATTNPPHATIHMPQTCADCHPTTTWTTSTFVHTPTIRTPHTGIACATCHQGGTAVATNYACISCHTHSQATTDGQHQGRAGYVYANTACLNCHPQLHH
jgi:hypothetical protein